MPLPRSAWLAFALAPLLGCSSSGDTTSPPPQPVVFDSGGGAAPKLEAGAPCATSNDCGGGFACLYAAGSSCDAFRVCAPAPASPCAQPSTVCSCLGLTITACAGFADEPVDHDGPCVDSGTIVPDAAVDHAVPPVDSGSEAGDAAAE
jgi:hypothetical protein